MDGRRWEEGFPGEQVLVGDRMGAAFQCSEGEVALGGEVLAVRGGLLEALV